jgi:hypothetical protein
MGLEKILSLTPGFQPGNKSGEGCDGERFLHTSTYLKVGVNYNLTNTLL